MSLRSWLRELMEDWRAKRRGEVRVAPRGTRGRIYAPKDAAAGGVIKVKPEPSARISARVIRADGTEEDFGEIARTRK